MADLGKKYQEILTELENKISDKNEFEFIKQKISELNIEYMDSINSVLQILKNQNKLDNKIRVLQNKINNIEEDIYITDDDEYDYDCNYNCEGRCGCDQMHDNDYEFEITCPYCDFEFITDNSYQNQREIKCPKCHKTIELDWNNNCGGECEHCKDYCYDEDKVAEQIEKYELDEDNNQDDM